MTEDRRLTKNEKRRQKKKQIDVKSLNNNQLHDSHVGNGINGKENVKNGSSSEASMDDFEVQIEYVSADIGNELTFGDKILDEFKSVFEKFAKPEDLTSLALISAAGDADESVKPGDDVDEVAAEEEEKLSKKKKKLMSRLSVAELKQLVQRPDVVEAHDVTSSDPRLLVFLKAYRNTVPVPRHWCHKRKYLQGKRGIEKPAFQLPEFIADTGIAKIRASVIEQESMKKSKQKAKDKVQPRMGKIDIDYQVLHDAFFKYQKKPKLIGHGDLYYEGREFELDMKEKKAGVLSPDLLAALGMSDATSAPPPWLINMQRYGPPPSYPNMRICGLNAPIPPGASFGYQPGGWGKPPVDEYGRPLYGDVFGVTVGDEGDIAVDRTTRWGQLEEVEEEEVEDEDEEEVEDEAGRETPMTVDGVSTIAGTETPDTIVDLRKRAGLETPDSFSSSRELYQVLQEKAVQSGNGNGQMFGSDRTYVLPKADVQVSINPDDLEDQLKDKDSFKDAYDAQAIGSAEFEERDEDGKGAKRKRRVDGSAATKRYKDFKF